MLISYENQDLFFGLLTVGLTESASADLELALKCCETEEKYLRRDTDFSVSIHNGSSTG